MYNAKQEPQARNKPSFTAYSIREGANENDSSFWTRIGSAWSHKDGNGFNLVLDALPQNGRIVLRVPTAKEK